MIVIVNRHQQPIKARMPCVLCIELARFSLLYCIPGGIFDKLKCFTEVSDDGLRQTFIVQMMGRKEVSDGLQHIKQNITSIISKAASKGKRKPVILMVSGVR